MQCSKGLAPVHKFIKEMPYSSTKDLFRSLMMSAGTHQMVSELSEGISKDGIFQTYSYSSLTKMVVRSKSHHSQTCWVCVCQLCVVFGKMGWVNAGLVPDVNTLCLCSSCPCRARWQVWATTPTTADGSFPVLQEPVLLSPFLFLMMTEGPRDGWILK